MSGDGWGHTLGRISLLLMRDLTVRAPAVPPLHGNLAQGDEGTAASAGASARARACGAWGMVSRVGTAEAAVLPALLLLALYAAFYVQFAIGLVEFPYDLDQGEGYDAWSAWLVHGGRLPYTSNVDYPYFSSNYPPLWSYLVSIPMAWTGPGLAPARAVSTAAGLLSALVVGLAARRLAHSAWAGALAGGLFLASPYVFHTTPLARVNGTALLLALLGLSLVETATRRRVVLATFALLASLFTKQTTLDAVAASLAFLAIARPRLSAASAALFAVVGGAGLGALQAATHGAFWTNVVAANANPFDVGQLGQYLRDFTLVHAVLLVLAVAECVALVRTSVWTPWLPYFPAALAMALMVGKWGAGESYFLGAIAASSVLAGSAAVRLARLGSRIRRNAGSDGRWRGVVVGVALLGQGLLFAHGPVADALPWLPVGGLQSDYLGKAPGAADREAGDEILGLITRRGGPALSEDPSFAVAAGRGVVGNATHLRNLYQAGLWDPAPLVADLRAKRYDVVILNAELYPEPVLLAIGRSYYRARTVRMNGSTYHVFFPGAD